MLPYLPRCSRWYHTVDFVADKKVVAEYGTDLGRQEKHLGRDRVRAIRDRNWVDAIEDVRAKPFYCN